MNSTKLLFLWLVVYVIGFIVLTKLDDWGREQDQAEQIPHHVIVD